MPWLLLSQTRLHLSSQLPHEVGATGIFPHTVARDRLFQFPVLVTMVHCTFCVLSNSTRCVIILMRGFLTAALICIRTHQHRVEIIIAIQWLPHMKLSYTMIVRSGKLEQWNKSAQTWVTPFVSDICAGIMFGWRVTMTSRIFCVLGIMLTANGCNWLRLTQIASTACLGTSIYCIYICIYIPYMTIAVIMLSTKS